MKKKSFQGQYDSDKLDVLMLPERFEEKFPGSICIVSRSGCLNFQFNMTPEQAIDLAAVLVEFATQDDEVTA